MVPHPFPILGEGEACHEKVVHPLLPSARRPAPVDRHARPFEPKPGHLQPRPAAPASPPAAHVCQPPINRRPDASPSGGEGEGDRLWPTGRGVSWRPGTARTRWWSSPVWSGRSSQRRGQGSRRRTFRTHQCGARWATSRGWIGRGTHSSDQRNEGTRGARAGGSAHRLPAGQPPVGRKLREDAARHHGEGQALGQGRVHDGLGGLRGAGGRRG